LLVIRIFLVIGPLALAACATPGAAAPNELNELKAEIRALRDENARLEKRLDRIELHASAGVRPPASATAPVTLPERAKDAVPSLTVVKLKPKQHAAPKLSTGVSIVEPGPEVLDNLKGESEAVVETDPEIGDAIFDQAIGSLKTGNVAGGILELQKFSAESPRHPKADNAIYFAGLGLMGLDDFDGAARAFEDVIARYPAGDAVLDSLVKLGECRVRLNKPADARVVYQKIVSSYPGTTAATAAKARLTSLTGSP
jgi:TolA-binding protein